MHTIPFDFTTKKVSPWGGIHLFHNIYQKYGLRDFLRGLDLSKLEGGSNRSYDPVDIIESFMVSVVLGSRRLAHSGMLRSDEVIQEIFGWSKGSPSASTFSRFFNKFDKQMNDELFIKLQKRTFEQVNIAKMTIDIDSTILTRFGHQEQACKGFNPARRGKRSHHPIMAFCDELKLVINSWMRSGNSKSDTDIEGFLDELFEIVEPQRIGLLRMDSGFYNQHIMSKIEKLSAPVNYLIKARLTAKLRKQIYEIDKWYQPENKDSCYQYSEIRYKGTQWNKARRAIITRKRKDYEISYSKQAQLFPELQEKESYEYYAFITNSNLSASVLHDLYNKRGDCENIIKELKYDYGIEGFAMNNFYATEAAFRLIMVAYNIMILFRQSVLTSKHRARLSTMKFQCIAIGSFVVRNGRNKMLKLSAEGKRRHFLAKIFKKVEYLPPNFSVSNA